MSGPVVTFTEEPLPQFRHQQLWRIYSTVDGVPREPYDEWRSIDYAAQSYERRTGQIDYEIDGPRHTSRGSR